MRSLAGNPSLGHNLGMKTFILSLTIALSVAPAAHAACNKAYAKATYAKLKAMPIRDKSMHCTLSCDLTPQCGSGLTMGLGIAKEVYDMFGKGNAEMADIRADLKGIKLARHGVARNFPQCLDACKALYEPK